MPKVIIVMGVSGSGKSSIASALAEKLGFRFVEGDALHPKENVDKMSRGIPLDDDDRWPWLDRIGAVAHDAIAGNDPVVLTCSALKKSYRDRLRSEAGGPVAFVYLHGSEALLNERMGQRKGHFMPLSLLKTQLNTLEEPTGEPGVVTVDIDATIEAIRDAAIADLEPLA